MIESLITARENITAATNDICYALVDSDPVAEIIIRQLHADVAAIETRITALCIALGVPRES